MTEKVTNFKEIRNIRAYRKYLVATSLNVAVQAVQTLQPRELFPHSGVPTEEQVKTIFGKNHMVGQCIHNLFDRVGFSEITDIGNLFMLRFMPRLLLFLAYSSHIEPGKYPPQYPESLEAALYCLYEAASSGRPLMLKTYLCPSYNYGFGENVSCRRYGACFTHVNGELLPTIGKRRFTLFSRATKFIFSPLIEHGVEVSLKYYAYTGVTKSKEDLWEIGQFVLEHYERKGDAAQIFMNMENVANEAKAICSSVNSKGFLTEYLAYEKLVIPKARELYQDLISTIFADGYDDRVLLIFTKELSIEGSRAYSVLNAWCKERLGLSAEFAVKYVSEEIKYREQQNINLDVSIFTCALKESLIYYVMNTQLPGIVWGGETSSNYQILMLKYLHQYGRLFPNIMLKPVNRVNPANIFGIREPFVPMLVTYKQAGKLFKINLQPRDLERLGLIRIRK